MGKEVFMLEARALNYKVGNNTILASVDLLFQEGGFHVLLGPNGAGKTTLLRLLAGESQPTSGNVLFEKKELSHYSKPDLARRRAVLSQHYEIVFPMSVQEVVLMGRYPYFNHSPAATDSRIVDDCLNAMEVAHLRHRDYASLSGGEAQKVQMSRVLAQIDGASEAYQKILFLDEPVSHLDIRFQQELLQKARSLLSKGVTVVAVLHDLNLAVKYGDRLIFMKHGLIVYDDVRPRDLKPAHIASVFEIEPTFLYDERGLPIVVL